MKMKRHGFLMILCLIFALAALSGCSNGNGRGDVAAAPEDAGKDTANNADDAGSETDGSGTDSQVKEGTLPEGMDFPEGFDPSMMDGRYSDAGMEKADKEKQQEAASSYVTGSISYLAIEQNPSPTPLPDGVSGMITQKLEFDDDGTYEFSKENRLYNRSVELTIKAPEGYTVRYTLDGTMPTAESEPYTEPLVFEAIEGDFPDCYMLRACAFDSKGNATKTAARSYLVSPEIDTRFSTAVFFVSGDPDGLLNLPDGIFAGKNYELRGRDSERMVYVEALDADGKELLSQYAGVRIYGGASRESSIKSMKLFSRKSYDEDHKNFKIDCFGTQKLDGTDEIIGKYDKLVLRNCGNDFQFSYIRDELSQTLCKKAGMQVYEGVVPAVCYLNGSYYGFFWLHENYCDKYFKEKFGDAPGEFIVIEGSEQKKADDDDALVQQNVDEYNEKYEYFVNADLKNGDVYRELCEFMDVENYLDFFAWNIALDNFDWPNNNFKCYRYVAADGEAAGSGVYDGRWRFLPHDMDYSYGLYDSTETQAKYNTLKIVMNPNHNRYAPLFTKLMERQDCADYFRGKTIEYVNGVLSPESIISAYEELHATRSAELEFFYRYLKQLNGKGDWSIWSEAYHYKNYEEQIYEFAQKRGEYVLKYMEEILG